MNWDSAHLRRLPEVCFPGAKASQKSLSIAASGVAHRAALTRHGFTLIELIVVIGVIAVLIGLMLPALSQSMISAKRTRAAATLRQAHLLVSMYTQQSKDVYPIAAETALMSSLSWHEAMIRAGLASSEQAIDPDGLRVNKTMTIALSETLVRKASELDPDGPEIDWKSAPTPVRTSDVVFPSERGTLFYWWVGWEKIRSFWCCGPYQPLAPAAMSDGNIVTARWTDYVISPPKSPKSGGGAPVVYTWYGFRGRDVVNRK